MADELLSQAELDTLLANVASGTAPKAASSPGHRVPAPHAPGFHAPTGAAAPLSALAAEVVELLDSRQRAELQALHEAFARKLSATLAGWLRLVVDVRVQSVGTCRFGPWIDGLDRPTFCQLIKVDGGSLRGAFDVQLPVLFVMIDRLLGGGREPAAVLRRPPTEIELRLAARLTNLVIDELNAAWQRQPSHALLPDRVETEPRTLGELPRDAAMLAVQCELRLNDTRGLLRLALPLVAIPSAAATTAGSQRVSGARPFEQTAGESASADEIELIVALPESKIAASDVAQLQPGDIIATEHAADAAVWVYQQGILRYQAHLGAQRGQKAVRIDEELPPPTAGQLPDD